MSLTFQHYDFTPILGWSISRYEVFDKCKRQYFYTYYSKYAPDIPNYKIKQLKDITSIPLEIGNVVHDVIEAFLRRLQMSDSNIDEQRFFMYAQEKARQAFMQKTFIENYYASTRQTNPEEAYSKITACLKNFIESPCYSWIFMKAIRNKNDWPIEPPGFGETRLNGLKAYCKMDFYSRLTVKYIFLTGKPEAKIPTSIPISLSGMLQPRTIILAFRGIHSSLKLSICIRHLMNSNVTRAKTTAISL